MSFWDNMKKFAQPYADDDYDDYDEEEDYLDYEEPAEAPRRPSRRAAAPAPAPAPAPMMDEEEEEDYGFTSVAPAVTTPAAPVAGFTGQVLGGRTSALNKQEVVLFRPVSFGDTTKAADALRSNKAVVLNLENVDKAMSRRVVDFLSGCVYALSGSVKKIAQSAYIFCPHNMDVVGDLESLQAEVESYI